MNTSMVLIIALFPSLILCASFAWDLNFTIDEVALDSSVLARSSPNGCVHLFWADSDAPRRYVMHQTLLPNGTLANKQVLSSNIYGVNSVTGISAKTSNDGSHIIVAYTGYRVDPWNYCYSHNTQSCYEIYFTESLNGGESWSNPIRMNRSNMTDHARREMPSILLEEDTGRIYLAYCNEYYLTISIREPGKTLFEPETIYLDKRLMYSMHLGYTIDKVNSMKHFHLFWGLQFGSVLNYAYSVDNTKTWSQSTILVTGASAKGPPAVAINTQVAETSIFVQYFQRNDIRLMWSKDHGKTWESPFRLGSDFTEYNRLTMCGLDGKGIVLSSNVRVALGNGYIRYLRPYEKRFVSISYPFSTIKNSGTLQSDISCGYMGNNQYSIAFIALDNDKHLLYLAHGILKDVTTIH